MFKTKRLSILSVLIAFLMIFTMTGVTHIAKAVGASFDKGLNPIPKSPPPPKEVLASFKPTVTYKNGMEFVCNAPGKYSVMVQERNSYTTFSTGDVTTINSRLNLYAACDSFTDNGTSQARINDLCQIAFDPSTGSSTKTLLMFPQVRDLFPPNATINSAKLVTGQVDYSQQPFAVDVFEITSSWDPRTFDATSIPSTSTSPIVSGLIDLFSPDATNRTLDVTTTFNNWLNGTSNQWGFMISTSTPDTSGLNLDYPLRLYVDYEMPEGSYLGGSSGASYYDDGICPPLWIPRRSIYIFKEGILGNTVIAGVFAATHTEPPFGYNIQSMNWIHDGKPIVQTSNQPTSFSTTKVPFPMNVQTVSPYTMISLMNSVPPVQAGMFWEGNDIGLGNKDCLVRNSIKENNADDYELDSVTCPGDPPAGPPIIEEDIIPPIEDKIPEDGICDPSLPGDPDCCPQTEGTQEEGYYGTDGKSDDPPFGIDIDGDGTPDDPPFDFSQNYTVDPGDIVEIEQECLPFDPGEDPIDPGCGGSGWDPPEEDPPWFPPYPPWSRPPEKNSSPPGAIIPNYQYSTQSTQWVVFDQGDVFSYSRGTFDTSQSGWESNWKKPGRASKASILGNLEGTSFSAENHWVRSGAPRLYSMPPGELPPIWPAPPPDPPNPIPPIEIIDPITGLPIDSIPGINLPELICAFPVDITDPQYCNNNDIPDWETIIEDLLGGEANLSATWSNVCDSSGMPTAQTMVIMGDTMPQAEYVVSEDTSPVSPVNPLNGQITYSTIDFSIACKGDLSLTFARHYSSANNDVLNGVLGPGWSTNTEMSLIIEDEARFSLVSAIGECINITPVYNQNHELKRFLVPDSFGGTVDVVVEENKTYIDISSSDGLTTNRFDPESGLLKSVSSKYGNSINLNYNSSGLLSSMVDNYSQRSINITYDQYNRIVDVTACGTRNWTYTYDANGDLSVATNPMGYTYQYEYDSLHRLVRIKDPRGNISKEYTYNTKGKVVKVSAPIDSTPGTEYELTVSYFGDKTSFEAISTEIWQPLGINANFESANYAERYVVMERPEGEQSLILMDRIGRLVALGDDNGDYAQFKYDYENPTQSQALYDQNGDCVSWKEVDHENHEISILDANGDAQVIGLNDDETVVEETTDREGNTTTIVWNNDETLVLKTIDALNREIIFDYDTQNNLISVTSPYKDGIPAVTEYEYDTYGYVSKVTDPMGKETSFEYNCFGELVKTTNALGKYTTYDTNKCGRITKVTGPAPSNLEMTYTYDPCMNKTAVTNPRGYQTVYTYDSENQLTTVTNALNQHIYYTYDTNGRIKSVKDDNNNESYVTYTNTGRLGTVTNNANYESSVVYDNLGNIKEYRNQSDELVCQYTYDNLNRVIEYINTGRDSTYYEYDKEGHVTKVTDALGRETSYVYDDIYRITSVTDNMNNTASLLYWPSGQVKQTISPLGQSSYYDYNKKGVLTQTKDNQLNTVNLIYDDIYRLIEAKDPLNNSTHYVYDEHGSLTSLTNKLGHTTTFDYDNNFNLVKKTTSLGREYEWEYDAIDRVTKSITPLGYEYIKTYDNVGNLVELKDPLNNIQKFEYTEDYKLEKYIDQLNNETSFTYDEFGRSKDVTNANLNKTQFEYDHANRISKVIDPIGNEATYIYDECGDLIERNLPNPSGGVTSFSYAYDLNGRRIGFTDEAGKSTTNTLNAIGQVESLIHPNSKSINMTYDTLQRVTNISFNGGESFSFGYDVLSRLTSTTDSHGSTSLTYDALSRVSSVTDHFNEQYSFTYDNDNRLIGYTSSLGTTTTTYDDDSRPTSVSLAGGGSISNSFDNSSRLTSSVLPNSTSVAYTYNNANCITQKNVTTSILFAANSEQPESCVSVKIDKDKETKIYKTSDSLESIYNIINDESLSSAEKVMLYSKYKAERLKGKDALTVGDLLTAYATPKSQSPNIPISTIANFTYTYDDTYNILARTDHSGTSQFTYDNYDRLTQAIMPDGTYTYTYDSRSNMLTKRFVNTAQTIDKTTSYVYSVDDRLTSYSVTDNLTQTVIETVANTYDDAGCLLTKAVTSGGTTLTTSYTYYDDLRIKTVTLPDTTTVTYTYFADGNRATKTTATEYVEYHYHSDTLFKEVHMDPSNHSTILFSVTYEGCRYIYDPGAVGGGDEVTYYPISDMNGTIRMLVDSSGSQVATYTYTPFGERLTNTAPTVYMPAGFGGSYLDTETGLLYSTSRYYDPHIARFTTKDSYRGAMTSLISQNRYIYCHQNPIKYSDPSGFAPVEGDHADPCIQTDQDKYLRPTNDELMPSVPRGVNGTLHMSDGEGDPPPDEEPPEEDPPPEGYYWSEWGTLIPHGTADRNIIKSGDDAGSFYVYVDGEKVIQTCGLKDGKVDAHFKASNTSSDSNKAVAKGLEDSFHSEDENLRNQLYNDVLANGKNNFEFFKSTAAGDGSDGLLAKQISHSRKTFFDTHLNATQYDYIWSTIVGYADANVCIGSLKDGTINAEDKEITFTDSDGNEVTMTLGEALEKYGETTLHEVLWDFGTADALGMSSPDYGDGYMGPPRPGQEYRRKLDVAFISEVDSSDPLSSPASLTSITKGNLFEFLMFSNFGAGWGALSGGYSENDKKISGQTENALKFIFNLVIDSTIGLAIDILSIVYPGEELTEKGKGTYLTREMEYLLAENGVRIDFEWHGMGGSHSNEISILQTIYGHSKMKSMLIRDNASNSGGGIQLGDSAWATVRFTDYYGELGFGTGDRLSIATSSIQFATGIDTIWDEHIVKWARKHHIKHLDILERVNKSDDYSNFSFTTGFGGTAGDGGPTSGGSGGSSSSIPTFPEHIGISFGANVADIGL